MSCRVMTSPSMPCTSVTCVTRRVPSRRRVRCTIRSSAEAICSGMARMGKSKPDMSVIVSMRLSVARGLLEWMVVMDPSWPVFMAWSMSSASPLRHSPTTIRSGRMRSEFFTRSRMVTSPRPSMLGGRDSSASTWSWWSWSSLASSMVTMRSSSGMNDESTLSVVVLPVPVPPDEHALRPVHHDLGDIDVLQEAVDGAIAQDVVGDVLDELRLVGGRERCLLLGQRRVELVGDAQAEIALAEAPVIEDRSELFDEVVVDLLAQF